MPVQPKLRCSKRQLFYEGVSYFHMHMCNIEHLNTCSDTERAKLGKTPFKPRISALELLQVIPFHACIRILYCHCLLIVPTQKGLTTPYSRFVKLDPSIPDLSIPDLMKRVHQENRGKQGANDIV